MSATVEQVKLHGGADKGQRQDRIVPRPGPPPPDLQLGGERFTTSLSIFKAEVPVLQGLFSPGS